MIEYLYRDYSGLGNKISEVVSTNWNKLMGTIFSPKVEPTIFEKAGTILGSIGSWFSSRDARTSRLLPGCRKLQPAIERARAGVDAQHTDRFFSR